MTKYFFLATTHRVELVASEDVQLAQLPPDAAAENVKRFGLFRIETAGRCTACKPPEVIESRCDGCDYSVG